MTLANEEFYPNYRDHRFPEIDNNPLLAHLNLPPETDKEAFLALGLRPKFHESERDLPAFARRLCINRLRRFFAPTLPIHRRALIEISSQLFDGYMPRNPMTPEGQAILHGGPVNLSYRPTISFIAGHSGMGKSTLIDRILAQMGNQVCRHKEFRGVPFPETQVLWLRRNVPEHCTVGTLCSTFGDYTDRVLRMSLYGGIFNKLKDAGRDLYLGEIRRIITNHHVGLLVLDEFQNLSLMGVGAKKIIAFLVNLRDDLGLPIVVAGTYKALRLLEGELSTARRLVEGGYFDLARPTSSEDPNWQNLSKTMWKYQWVRNPITEYSPEIGHALYDISQGINGIAISGFAATQLVAIEDGSERVTAELIRKVFEERMQPLHPAIRILKSGDPRLMDTFEDIYMNLYPSSTNYSTEPPTNETNDFPEAEQRTIHMEDGREPVKKKSKSETSSGSRAKPPLTAEQIKALVTADSMADLIATLDE